MTTRSPDSLQWYRQPRAHTQLIVQVANWIRFSFKEPASTLSDTFRLLADFVRERGTVKMLPPGERHLKLPQQLSLYPNMKIWRSKDDILTIPLGCGPVTEEIEGAILHTMLLELHTKLIFELSISPSFSRIINIATPEKNSHKGGLPHGGI